VNQRVRNLIGEPSATLVDTQIAIALAVPAVMAVLEGLESFGGTLVDRDPIWGNASIDDIVDARLGALGIVK
jgi:hypothetical protein